MRSIKTYLAIVVLAAMGITQQAGAKSWTLNECIDYALANNITLKKNVLQQRSALEDVKQAQAALMPSLSASTSQNVGYTPWPQEGQFVVNGDQVETRSNKASYNGSYGFNTSWTVWNGNQNRNQVKLNKLAAQQAELDSAETANLLKEQIAQLYVQILYSAEAISVNKESLATSQQNEDRGKEMVEVGSLSRADLAQLSAQRAQDEYNIVQAESNLKPPMAFVAMPISTLSSARRLTPTAVLHQRCPLGKPSRPCGESPNRSRCQRRWIPRYA